MEILHKPMNRVRFGTEAIVALAILILGIAGSAVSARADDSVALMNQVNAALRANDNLNGAMSYSPAPGVVVLYGVVFDEKDRKVAEQAARGVGGVNQVVDNLRTKTGKWFQEEERINTQLQMNGFNDVQVKVVGPDVYLSGKVKNQAEKQRAANVVASVSKLQVNNMLWVKPPSLF
jgi:osmotically-inducible protein OsmY